MDLKSISSRIAAFNPLATEDASLPKTDAKALLTFSLFGKKVADVTADTKGGSSVTWAIRKTYNSITGAIPKLLSGLGVVPRSFWGAKTAFEEDLSDQSDALKSADSEKNIGIQTFYLFAQASEKAKVAKDIATRNPGHVKIQELAKTAIKAAGRAHDAFKQQDITGAQQSLTEATDAIEEASNLDPVNQAKKEIDQLITKFTDAVIRLNGAHNTFATSKKSAQRLDQGPAEGLAMAQKQFQEVEEKLKPYGLKGSNTGEITRSDSTCVAKVDCKTKGVTRYEDVIAEVAKNSVNIFSV